MTDPIPEQVYLDAARAYSADLPEHLKDDCAQAVFDDPAHRASFESAYRAGYGQGRDDEAANRPLDIVLLDAINVLHSAAADESEQQLYRTGFANSAAALERWRLAASAPEEPR